LRISYPFYKKLFESHKGVVEGEESFLLRAIFSAIKSLFDVCSDLGRALLSVDQLSVDDQVLNLSADRGIRD
jgi:hypothetical protein